MTISVETFMVVSLAFAVFAAITAIGASIMLSVGYERLRSGLLRLKEGLDLVSRQTGFFSEAIHKLDEKVTSVDTQTMRFSASIDSLQSSVERVDKQTEFFSDALQRLEVKIHDVEQAPKAIELKNLLAHPKVHDKNEPQEDLSSMMIISADTLQQQEAQDWLRPSSFLDQVTGLKGTDIRFH